MFRVIILAAIVVSSSAQSGHSRGFQERQNPQTYSEESLSQEYDGNVRVNPRHRHGAHVRTNVGGFQNGNFAPHDGRLKTNLNSGRGASESRRNNFQSEGTYVVEGAAFNRQENQFFNSNQGNLADNSHFENNQQRRESQNIETQDRRRLEQSLYNNQRALNTNEQRQRDQNIEYNEPSALRNTNNRNRFTNQETQNENKNGNLEVTLDLNRRERDQNENQNSQEPNTQADGNKNEGKTHNQTTKQQSHVDLNTRRATNANINQPSSQNNPQANQNISSNVNNQNNDNHFDRNRETESSINNKSRAIASTISKNLYLDKEAKEREINKQITKLIFEESTQPMKKGKTTEDNELHTEHPNRNVSGKKDDRWIWSDGSEVNATIEDSTTPGVDDRAAFVGSQCPTGQTKLNGMCVDED